MHGRCAQYVSATLKLSIPWFEETCLCLQVFAEDVFTNTAKFSEVNHQYIRDCYTQNKQQREHRDLMY